MMLARKAVSIFLAGDVMTGRGIDQILRHNSDPILYEGCVKSAKDYVSLAEKKNGHIPRFVSNEYIWGDALEELERHDIDLRVVNLETSITTSSTPWPEKGIHYRMHPSNVGVLTAAKIDGCVLGNNHVMDWGYSGLEDTLAALHSVGIKTAGAGRSLREAESPAVFQIGEGHRVLLFSAGSASSGVPSSWAATEGGQGLGVHFLLEPSGGEPVGDFIQRTVTHWRLLIERNRVPGDVVILSLHWGSNWGYDISPTRRQLAHALIDEAGVDILFGHSSHHPRAVELYHNKPILYGAGDFINDYDGITNHEEYRSELCFGYLLKIDVETRRLLELKLLPFEMDKFRLNRPSPEDVDWLYRRMEDECRRLGHSLQRNEDMSFSLV